VPLPSDPIQNNSTDIVGREERPELSDMNSFNNDSLIGGNQRCVSQAEVANFRIEAERLFNIGMNLGISSNEDRISMVERLIDSHGVGDVVGDMEVDK
jgi:hypothetical protein